MQNSRSGRKRKIFLWILILILAVVIGYCLSRIIPYFMNNARSKETYQALSKEYAPDHKKEKNGQGTKQADAWYEALDPDLVRMRKKYPDVCAWLYFDNQDEHPISYPVLYSGDDTRYLRHDIDGNYSIAGCLFLEGLNKPDFSDKTSFIYGHLMNNETMFGSLKKYKEEGHYEKSRYFTIFRPGEACHYRIFSFFETPAGSEVYQTGFAEDETYAEYLKMLCEKSLYRTRVEPAVKDRIVILSTCSRFHSQERLVVCGVPEETHR